MDKTCPALEAIPTEEAIRKLIDLLESLQKMARKQFSPEECPLNKQAKEDHCDLSKKIWGTGSYIWECGFCGMKFEE